MICRWWCHYIELHYMLNLPLYIARVRIAKFQFRTLPAARRTQPISISQNFFNNPFLISYNGYTVGKQQHNQVGTYSCIQQYQRLSEQDYLPGRGEFDPLCALHGVHHPVSQVNILKKTGIKTRFFFHGSDRVHFSKF